VLPANHGTIWRAGKKHDRSTILAVAGGSMAAYNPNIHERERPMTDAHPTSPAPAPTPAPAEKSRVPTTPAAIVAAIMTVLAVAGTMITIADATWAGRYWLFLVPVYGLLCILTVSYRRGVYGETVGLQILHWAAVALAIAVDFAFLQGSGQQTATGTGLSSLLILALGCLIAGIHLEWLFTLVGLLLMLIVVMVAVAQEYLMLVFVAAVVVLAIVLAAPRLTKRWFG
jgi:hypothetical protein